MLDTTRFVFCRCNEACAAEIDWALAYSDRENGSEYFGYSQPKTFASTQLSEHAFEQRHRTMTTPSKPASQAWLSSRLCAACKTLLISIGAKR
jgi:hypothetical protein